jgi:transposase
MARPYSDDLRRRILRAYGAGELTLEQLAQRFDVSYGYVKKIRRQQLRYQQMERVPHHPGRKPKFTAPSRERLRGWLRQQPDLTLTELQDKLLQQAQLHVSQPSLGGCCGRRWACVLKKSVRAQEQDSPRIQQQRQLWQQKSARSKPDNGPSGG